MTETEQCYLKWAEEKPLTTRAGICCNFRNFAGFSNLIALGHHRTSSKEKSTWRMRFPLVLLNHFDVISIVLSVLFIVSIFNDF